MTRLKSIVAFVLLTILYHLLAASQEGKDLALDAQLEREKRWDEWKKLGKAGALVGEKVINLLIEPLRNTFLVEALSSSADRLLEVESEEYRAIRELTSIVERQHETSLRRFNEMEWPLKDLISDNDYSNDVELYLWSLLNAYNEYSDSIGKSKELQNIKMDRLGEECEFYKPIASLRKILNTVEHCFLSDDSSNLYRQTLEGNAIMRFHNLTNILSQEHVCNLERAYHVKENQSVSLSNTVDAIMSNVEQLIVFSRICSAVVHKDNALEWEDVFNTTAKIGAEINSKMVEWAENRFNNRATAVEKGTFQEGAWPDEMRSKAIEIIESFTQDDEIPQYDLQKLSDRIRTAMQSMASRKYAYQVMLISTKNVNPIYNVNYSYTKNFKYNFAVENVKKVSVIVSRHIYRLADCQNAHLTINELFSLQKVITNHTFVPDSFTQYEHHYNTILSVIVHLYGIQNDCASHTAFFARSMELYEKKCRNAARLIISSPAADPGVFRSDTYCDWFFAFM